MELKLLVGVGVMGRGGGGRGGGDGLFYGGIGPHRTKKTEDRNRGGGKRNSKNSETARREKGGSDILLPNSTLATDKG